MICVYVAFPFWLLKEWFASCVRKTKSVCNSSTKRSSRTTGLNISAILTVLFQFAFQATYWQCSWQSLSQIGKLFWCVLPDSRHTPPRVVHDPSEAKKNGYKMNPCHGDLRTSAAVFGCNDTSHIQMEDSPLQVPRDFKLVVLILVFGM